MQRRRPGTAGTDDGGDPAALERLLGAPEMAWLVQRVRSRIVQSEGAVLMGVVQLRDPTPAQRAAVVGLVGRSPRAGSTLRVDLAQVEEILRRGPWPAGLADAVVALTGPVVDRRSQRAQESAAWERAAALADQPLERFPGLAAWWHAWCAAGGLKRVARSEATRLGVGAGPVVAEQLVHTLTKLLGVLPGSQVPLAVFARQVTGDAHGLDDSRPLGRLAVSVVREAFATADTPDAVVSARVAWARAGVVLSNVSSTVLTLGVRGVPSGRGLGAATAMALNAMAGARCPMLLTLDQVRSGGVAPLDAETTVHVCENPTVVEVVAARWAALPGDTADPVLVCTSGQPSTAAIELLETLVADGAQCRYHGDFDWAGLRIARGLHTRIPWQPWRFTAADYLAAAWDDDSSLPLAGSPADTPWDPELAEVMQQVGRAIEEEAVADLLADDILPTGDRSQG